MRLFHSKTAAWLGGAVVVAALAMPAGAAQAQAAHDQVISANPFGLLLELFNAEYERVISESSTIGIGGSFADFEEGDSDETYVNGDVFWRFYPQGRPLEGWAFGVKAGLTSGDLIANAVEESETYFGFGFDLNHSWLLGRNENFYVGLGFGLKRLLGANEADIEVIPTFRLVNIGFAF